MQDLLKLGMVFMSNIYLTTTAYRYYFCLATLCHMFKKNPDDLLRSCHITEDVHNTMHKLMYYKPSNLLSGPLPGVIPRFLYVIARVSGMIGVLGKPETSCFSSLVSCS